LIIGTLVVVILITLLFFFVIIYQRKMLHSQVQLRKLHDVQQTELLKAVVETQENERKRLAEDLHDSVGQVLSAIKLNLHRLDKTVDEDKLKSLLSDTRNLTDDSIEEIRNIIHNVLPPVLTDFGFIVALKALCEKIEDATGVKIKLVKNIGDERYAPAIELALYRIVQEIFSNTIKHADASAIQVTLNREHESLVILIADNGIGFDMKAIKHGFGLKNLQSRVQLINGKIDYYTKPGHGTLITIKVLTSKI
jgi:signal transduction histidine kinase